MPVAEKALRGAFASSGVGTKMAGMIKTEAQLLFLTGQDCIVEIVVHSYIPRHQYMKIFVVGAFIATNAFMIRPLLVVDVWLKE